MVKALLGKIEGLFDKEFLFASFLPTLVFLASVALTLAGMVGFDSLWAGLESWTATQKATATAIAGVGAVIFAYLVHGLRPVFLLLWSGRVEGPFRPLLRLGEEVHRRRFLALREKAFRPSRWEGLFEWFRLQVEPNWDATKPTLPEVRREELMRDVRRLNEGMSPEVVRAHLTASVIHAYKSFSGNALVDVYAAVRQTVEDWDRQEGADLSSERAKLDRRFGTLQSIRATALGNVVESYNLYPFKRYRIDSEVFWPHLQYVIKKEFLDTIREYRIMLDFSLAMATLGMLFAALAAIGGPWLWFRPAFWTILVGGAVIVCYGIYYRMAVFLATQYGDLVRASFDLFRLDLLDALYRAHPTTRAAELEEWEQASQLHIFGQVRDYELRPRR